MIPSEWVDQAAARIAPHIVRTPLTYDAARNIFIKWENRQKTGSFKARGALNKTFSLSDRERERGIVTASAGNHGQGVALAGNLTGARVTCFVPDQAVPAKVNAIRALGARVVSVEGKYPEAEAAGRKFAAENRMVFISAYNDEHVIAGQGTIGLEIAEQLADLTGQRQIGNSTWMVPVSGGGLIAGVGAALARFSPRPRLVGVQPEAAPFMHSLFYHGSQAGIPDLPTLADGLTGAVEAGSITIPMVSQCVDEITLVSEEETARAVAFAHYQCNEIAEPSGAVTLAAALRAGPRDAPSRASRVAIVSGGNTQPEIHERIVAEYAQENWK